MQTDEPKFKEEAKAILPRLQNRAGRREHHGVRFRLPRPGHVDKFWEWSPTKAWPMKTKVKIQIKNKMAKNSRRKNRP